MSRVIFDMSMSLDGFVVASGATPDEPLGKGGERLHDWALSGDHSAVDAAIARTGAYICGRRTYDDSLPWWGPNGPTGDTRMPLFVVTHRAPSTSPENGVYTFVTDGIGSALRQAKAVAGDKDVTVMGGPDLGCQFIRAGLADHIEVHQVPTLFGAGKRLFEHLGDGHLQLDVVNVIDTPQVTHLLYRIRHIR